jgi:hypothetical protein
MALFYQTYRLANVPKLAWTNADALVTMDKVYRNIPVTEYILDLDGRTMYYPSPYFACCIPFGQFAPFLSRSLPSLSHALERTKTKYIYQGQLERVKTLEQADQAYIREHYAPMDGDIQILRRID